MFRESGACVAPLFLLNLGTRVLMAGSNFTLQLLVRLVAGAPDLSAGASC
jgi:hypothetical protein